MMPHPGRRIDTIGLAGSERNRCINILDGNSRYCFILVRMAPQIVDRIDECAFVPERWRGMPGERAQVAAARTGFLFVSNGWIRDRTSSTDIRIAAPKPSVESGSIARSARFRRQPAANHCRIPTDSDGFVLEKMKLDLSYECILYPRSLGWAAGTAVSLPTVDQVCIDPERDCHLRPVVTPVIQRLDERWPNSARSALLFAQLQPERARGQRNIGRDRPAIPCDERVWPHARRQRSDRGNDEAHRLANARPRCIKGPIRQQAVARRPRVKHCDRRDSHPLLFGWA